MVMLITTQNVSYAFGLIFAACELSQRLNLAFDECSEMFTQFEWYLFPEEIKRIWPTLINFVQQLVELGCFGTTACNRETFKSVSG